MIRDLLSGHAGPRHVSYLDVPLGETTSRHAGRPPGADVPSEKLRRWYAHRDVLGTEGEIVIQAGDLSLRDDLSLIIRAIGPVPPPARPAARHL